MEAVEAKPDDVPMRWREASDVDEVRVVGGCLLGPSSGTFELPPASSNGTLGSVSIGTTTSVSSSKY
jgi:hypothetical protein